MHPRTKLIGGGLGADHGAFKQKSRARGKRKKGAAEPFNTKNSAPDSPDIKRLALTERIDELRGGGEGKVGTSDEQKNVEREILGQKGLHRYLFDLRAAFNSEMGDSSVLQQKN